jgi:hypothetical protein
MAFTVPSTFYTIIYVRFLYPLCTPYVGYMKSKNFQKRQKKAKIGQKSQNWPKKPKLSKKAKIIQNLAFLSFGFFWLFLAFLENFGFFGKFWIFRNELAVCHFGRLHKDYIDREYMTQSR